jgi:hypothetical protein
MFGGQKIILVFLTTYAKNKKLACGSVGDKNFNLCSVSCLPINPVLGTVLKSNTVQLKLSCSVPYFLKTNLLKELSLI